MIIHNPGPEALGDDLLGFGGEDDRRTRRTKRGGQREVGDSCSGTNAAMGQRNAGEAFDLQAEVWSRYFDPLIFLS